MRAGGHPARRGSWGSLPHRSPRSSSSSDWTCASTWGAQGGPWFYLRLGPEAGLTLIRVLREGLWLLEYLGGTAGRVNGLNETTSRTHVPDRWSRRRGERPSYRSACARGIIAPARSASLDRSTLLFSTVVTSPPRASASASLGPTPGASHARGAPDKTVVTVLAASSPPWPRP